MHSLVAAHTVMSSRVQVIAGAEDYMVDHKESGALFRFNYKEVRSRAAFAMHLRMRPAIRECKSCGVWRV